MYAGTWEFIGECYLYEMMDGQALSGVDNSLRFVVRGSRNSNVTIPHLKVISSEVLYYILKYYRIKYMLYL